MLHPHITTWLETKFFCWKQLVLIYDTRLFHTWWTAKLHMSQNRITLEFWHSPSIHIQQTASSSITAGAAPSPPLPQLWNNTNRVKQSVHCSSAEHFAYFLDWPKHGTTSVRKKPLWQMEVLQNPVCHLPFNSKLLLLLWFILQGKTLNKHFHSSILQYVKEDMPVKIRCFPIRTELCSVCAQISG